MSIEQMEQLLAQVALLEHSAALCPGAKGPTSTYMYVVVQSVNAKLECITLMRLRLLRDSRWRTSQSSCATFCALCDISSENERLVTVICFDGLLRIHDVEVTDC